MRILTRALAILTWKHLAGMLAIVAFLTVTSRLAMVGNIVDRMSLESWISDFWIGSVLAAFYLAAVILAEAAAPPGTAPTLKGYFIATLAASALVLVVYPLWSPTGPLNPGPGQERAYERMMARLKDPSALRRQYVMSAAATVMFLSLATFAYAGMRRSRLAWRALAEAELARSEAQRELLAARMGSAQTVAEPAQVLARLAEIEAMYEHDRGRADAMMDELIAFLRAAIPRLRLELAEGSGR